MSEFTCCSVTCDPGPVLVAMQVPLMGTAATPYPATPSGHLGVRRVPLGQGLPRGLAVG